MRMRIRVSSLSQASHCGSRNRSWHSSDIADTSTAVVDKKIDFSNIPLSAKKSEAIPKGFEGFIWSNWKYIDAESSASNWRRHFARQRVIATIADSSASMFVERSSGKVLTLGAIQLGSNMNFPISPVLTGEADGKQLYCKPVTIEKGQTLFLVLNWTSIKRFGIEKERPDKYLHHPVIYSLTIGNVFNVSVSSNSKCKCCTLS